MKNHPANAGGISVPSKLRLPIRLKVGLEFAFHRLTPVVCAFDVINTVLWRENYADDAFNDGIYRIWQNNNCQRA